MTNLQVSYWNLKESERTNRANERLRGEELSETIRHNMATESIEWARIGEASRHNKATESATMFHYETERSYNQMWKEVQDHTLALREREYELDVRNFELKSIDTIGRLTLDTSRYLTDRDISYEKLDIQRQELELDKEKNRREWFQFGANTFFNWRNSGREDFKAGLSALSTVGSFFSRSENTIGSLFK